MSRWPGCPVIACANDLCAERCQAGTDIVERLHVIRAHLRTGALGQREVWEKWLTEAAAEIEQMRAAGRDLLYAIGHDREDMINDAAEKMRRALEPKP